MVADQQRRRTPAEVAVIDRDRCTGCQACCAVCPVDCIEWVRHAPGVCGVDSWCRIDADRCIGCKLCIRLAQPPSRKPYELKICPWDAITLVPVGAESSR